MTLHGYSIESRIGRIALPVSFDHASTLKLRIPFIRLLRHDDTRHLIVDLSRVSYIDGFGVGTLVAWDEACRADGKALVLEKCSLEVTRLLRRIGVHRSFNYAPMA